MTTQDDNEEELLLAQQLLDARHRLKLHQQETSERKYTQRKLENEVEDLEQAAFDYMRSNGLVESERLSVRKSMVVDVPDIEAVPDEFIRTKITKEPNKVLIKELAPAGNWYTLRECESIVVKGIAI